MFRSGLGMILVFIRSAVDRKPVDLGVKRRIAVSCKLCHDSILADAASSEFRQHSRVFLGDKPGKVTRGRMETNHFLFIISGWQGAMIWPGGTAMYIDTLVRGLMSLGDTVKVLAVVQPNENEPIGLLETHEPWIIPFQLAHDEKPANWLGRKCVSFLEILRCLSPNCRRVLERTSFFAASTASIARLEELLSQEQPTTIVFGYLDVNLYALALSLLERQRPYGIIAHDSEIYRFPNNKKNDLVKRGMILKGAGWIAANSRHTKSLLEAWRIPSGRVKIVHPPISEEAMRESAVLEPVVRKDDGLSLVTICRLVKGKGIDIVLRALKILAARGIPYRYVIGGEGPERGFLEALVDELGLGGRVHFKGSVVGEEKWRLLRNGDVFVMPSRLDSTISWQEGFGIAFVEAAAFGVPAVGSRSGGIPDAVVDGETGILVPEESPSELADALTFLYRNPEIRNEMGRAARERARREFSPRAVALRFREEISKGVYSQQ
jgi:glycosyltransferase involved in cell wall biosynthesis